MNNYERLDMMCKWAQNIATDDTHGYSQLNRWSPNYDCSSLVISACEYIGIPLKSYGATFTGNLAAALLRAGFVEVHTGDIKRGDIGLTHRSDKRHCAIYLGNGYMIHASGAHGHPETGDQTGKEICIATATKFDNIYRFTGYTKHTCIISATMPELTINDCGKCVNLLQYCLNELGYVCAIDGDIGNETFTRIKDYQKMSGHGLVIDGICGKNTWSCLLTDMGVV